VEIEEIKTEQNVARMWKNDPNNPANIAKQTEVNDAAGAAKPEGSKEVVGELGQKAAGNVETGPVAAERQQTEAEVTRQAETNEEKEPVDEFEIQEDEITQFRSAQENEQMKKDYEKKLEIANSKLRFAELELEKFKKARNAQATATSRSEKVCIQIFCEILNNFLNQQIFLIV